ncbi:phosphoribosyl-AMP cyclohydrolase [Microbulbifer thermotolerans]|uniref:Phosphoribosyl-AMP cyclohydrolase n=1 Tax=Microbulbifer thermotolerans TaxID=252514 RepID=A0A143HQN6_MICTH|nr:phosphoribosyl-AMP cyclohydrolase [Microbulbifer thermotolerans]AMX03816.1 phosphoribosyl-AMP cyclohydrolase [Microbulbifer thermotolerans]MCX2778689.1 phosphoribosyl-AMP cyclohydrolase [Microbulbifer thermotolerans]MCX2783761.1 phosphoribosyl-AMP cyclohydrolase [Microbulbifer thermotolerans]MCX2794158.1 phosphoribosyl-AMP cyclohydrolase [Microbulbifer thermotolerans]MCX2803123.1 phosphoribosyl-AMP cyclohydrolase [Microbulbifer thermotolerans]
MTNADTSTSFIDQVSWNSDGLVPAIAQDFETGRVLMMAWMNRESLALTASEGYAVYWSRSRNKLWRKGESSGHLQQVREIRLDCDGDTVLLLVEQQGGIACHTGRASCFYNLLQDGEWKENQPVLRDPESIYEGKA